MSTFQDALNKAADLNSVVPTTDEVDKTMDIEELLGHKLIITGIKPLKGNKGPFLFITACMESEDAQFGFTCGGKVVMEKLNLIDEKQAFPVAVIITQTESEKGAYYDLADWSTLDQ